MANLLRGGIFLWQQRLLRGVGQWEIILNLMSIIRSHFDCVEYNNSLVLLFYGDGGCELEIPREIGVHKNVSYCNSCTILQTTPDRRFRAYGNACTIETLTIAGAVCQQETSRYNNTLLPNFCSIPISDSANSAGPGYTTDRPPDLEPFNFFTTNTLLEAVIEAKNGKRK